MNILDTLNLSLPIYETKLPISKKSVSFTPFKVKDIKNLSIVLEEKNKKLAFLAMVNILKNNCSQFESLINEICLADAEYLFLKIRSKSVDENLNLLVNDKKVQLNIDDILHRNSFKNESVKITESITLELRTPSIKDLLEIEEFSLQNMIKCSIKKIILKNEIYHTNRFVPEELKNVIDNLPLNSLNKIQTFLKNQPELYAEISLNDEKKEVSGMLDFFIFR